MFGKKFEGGEGVKNTRNQGTGEDVNGGAMGREEWSIHITCSKIHYCFTYNLFNNFI